MFYFSYNCRIILHLCKLWLLSYKINSDNRGNKSKLYIVIQINKILNKKFKEKKMSKCSNYLTSAQSTTTKMYAYKNPREQEGELIFLSIKNSQNKMMCWILV